MKTCLIIFLWRYVQITFKLKALKIVLAVSSCILIHYYVKNVMSPLLLLFLLVKSYQGIKTSLQKVYKHICVGINKNTRHCFLINWTLLLDWTFIFSLHSKHQWSLQCYSLFKTPKCVLFQSLNNLLVSFLIYIST